MPTTHASPSPGAAASCPACGAAASDEAAFCEECGAAIVVAAESAAAPVVEPGADDDGAGADDDDAGSDAADLPLEFGTPDLYGTPAAGVGSVGAYATSHVAAAPSVRVCSYCQGTIAPDGYCLECGEREVSARDRFGERPAAWLAGVSDIGLVHRRNEDALSLAVAFGGGSAPTGTGIVVVCDGVTTAPDSDVASLAASQAASGAMWRTITDGDPRAPRQGLLTAAVRAGHEAASRAVLETTSPDLPEEDAPSCTFVACAVEPGTIVAGWAGDSRAYWLPDVGQPVALTRDHSWAAEMVAEGMSETEAMAQRNAHAITRWVGRDAPGEGAEIRAIHPDGAGTVLVCSDGLWNYAPETAALADVVTRLTAEAGASVEALAVALVDWARAQGGRDNISVALARLDRVQERASAPQAPTAPQQATAPETAETRTDPEGEDTDGDVQR